MNLGDQTVDVTGFAPGQWSWATTTTGGVTATLSITAGGVYTANLLMREDGLRIDRLLLTTDTTPTVPTGFGPPETNRQLGSGGLVTPLTRTIVYTYDNLYRLTEADYTSGQSYAYSYDPVGNRLQQIIDGDTTTYQYDAANRLEQLNGQSVYTFDNNGNLLNSDTLTNTFDAANRLIETERSGSTLEPIYNGVGDRVGQTTSVTTTYFALDVMGLPEVIYTTEGNLYLHLPGVIMAENSSGEIRYLLSDGLGSVRQATDESGEVVAYNEFDPYGNPVQDDSSPYGFTGEWWENDIGLLHLRARWYAPETGTFVSRDSLSPIPEYTYASNNPINRVDPSGYVDWSSCVIGPEVATCKLEFNDTLWGIAREVIYLNGNANAFNDQRINRVMVPEMKIRNPNLYSASVGWDCPTCLADTINLPASWIKGFMTVVAPSSPHPGEQSPVRTVPPVPLPPNNGCPLPNPKPLGPIRIELRSPQFPIPTEIILFPPGVPHTIKGNKNETIANIASWAGFGADLAELASMTSLIPGLPDAMAVVDIGITTVASRYSGETYVLQQPHESLPPMIVIGQDVIWTSSDAGIAYLSKIILPILGFEDGGLPGAMVGYIGGMAVDVGTTTASVIYDGSRLAGAQTYFSYAVFWEGGPRQAILIHPDSP